MVQHYFIIVHYYVNTVQYTLLFFIKYLKTTFFTDVNTVQYIFLHYTILTVHLIT